MPKWNKPVLVKHFLLTFIIHFEMYIWLKCIPIPSFSFSSFQVLPGVLPCTPTCPPSQVNSCFFFDYDFNDRERKLNINEINSECDCKKDIAGSWKVKRGGSAIYKVGRESKPDGV